MEWVYGEFGQRLKEARTKAGLSQEGLALRVGLSRTSITNIEGGRQRVPLHTLIDLASAVGRQPGELLPNSREDVSVPVTREIWQGTPARHQELVRNIVSKSGVEPTHD